MWLKRSIWLKILPTRRLIKEIIGKKAHYPENGKLRSRAPLNREQVKKFAFTGGRWSASAYSLRAEM